LKYVAQGIPQIDTACPGVALAKSEDCETGDPPEGWGVRAHRRGQTGDPPEGWGVQAQRGQK